MAVVILGILGVILFVIGISFLFRGYLAVPQEGSMVPVSEHESLQQALNATKTSEQKIRNELAAATSELNGQRESLAGAQNSEENLRKEIARLKNDLEKNEAQLIQAIGQLDDFKLQGESQKQAGAVVESKTKEVESQLFQAQEKLVDQAKGSLEIIGSLKAEVNALKDSTSKQQTVAQGAQKQIDEIKGQKEKELADTLKTIEGLKSENNSLKAQIESCNSTIQEFDSKISETKDDRKQQLEITLKAVEELKVENEVLRVKVQQDLNDLDSLKKENEVLKSKVLEGEDMATLKELNAQLMEKEKAAQYELAKSRAQASGLEKICADFKIKFEGIEQLEEDLKNTKVAIEILKRENASLKASNSQA